MMTTNFNIRIDKDIKEHAEGIFNELGINMTTAVNIFLRTAIREHGIPFELKLDMQREAALWLNTTAGDQTPRKEFLNCFKEEGYAIHYAPI